MESNSTGSILPEGGLALLAVQLSSRLSEVVKEYRMSKKKKKAQPVAELVPVRPTEVMIAPPQSGVMGQFLADTENMFRARSMRMKGLFARINDTGQRMEGLLRMAAEAMDAAEAKLEEDFRHQGLMADADEDEATEDDVD
jgi:hypothetical protein